MMVYIVAVLWIMDPFLWIFVSYGKIISMILRFQSTTGQAKDFSTCSSPLIVMALFFGSAVMKYLRRRTQDSKGTDQVLSLFYTIVTLLFNPTIYSLKNKDVIMALRKLSHKLFILLKI